MASFASTEATWTKSHLDLTATARQLTLSKQSLYLPMLPSTKFEPDLLQPFEMINLPKSRCGHFLLSKSEIPKVSNLRKPPKYFPETCPNTRDNLEEVP